MNSLKQWSHHSITAARFYFESAGELGNRPTCSTALMVTSLSTKQPWHTEYCHLKFSYSDLSADYATHYMLTLTKNYAVKTGQPREQLAIDNWQLEIQIYNYYILSLLIANCILVIFLSPIQTNRCHLRK